MEPLFNTFLRSGPAVDVVSKGLDAEDLKSLRLVNRTASNEVPASVGFETEVRHVIDAEFLGIWASSGEPPFLYSPKHIHIQLEEKEEWSDKMEEGLPTWNASLIKLETVKVCVSGTASRATRHFLLKLLENQRSTGLISDSNTLDILTRVQGLESFLAEQVHLRIEGEGGDDDVEQGVKNVSPNLAPFIGLRTLAFPKPSGGGSYTVLRPRAIEPISGDLDVLEILSCATLGEPASREQVRDLRSYLERLISQLRGLLSIEKIAIAFPYNPRCRSSRSGDEADAEFLFHSFLSEQVLPFLQELRIEMEIFTPRWFSLLDTCSQRETISELEIKTGSFFGGFERWDREDMADLSGLNLTKFHLTQNKWLRRGYRGQRAGFVPLVRAILSNLPATVTDIRVELIHDPGFDAVVGDNGSAAVGGAWLECREPIQDEDRLPWASGVERLVLKGFEAVLDLGLLRRLADVDEGVMPGLKHLEIEQRRDVRADALKVIYGEEEGTRMGQSLESGEKVCARLRTFGDRNGFQFLLSVAPGGN